MLSRDLNLSLNIVRFENKCGICSASQSAIIIRRQSAAKKQATSISWRKWVPSDPIPVTLIAADPATDPRNRDDAARSRVIAQAPMDDPGENIFVVFILLQNKTPSRSP